MAERELKLNSLGRYGKGGSRLVLEEHGHCEVPAGCGGAVLRWRNPNSGLLFLLHAFGNDEILLDGAPPSSGRPLIPFRELVLSLAVTELAPGSAVLGFAAIHDESQFGVLASRNRAAGKSPSFPPPPAPGNMRICGADPSRQRDRVGRL